VVVARGQIRGVRWVREPFHLQLVHFLLGDFRMMRARVVHEHEDFALAQEFGRDPDRHLFQLGSEEVSLDGDAGREDLPVDGTEDGEEETEEFLLSVKFRLWSLLGFLIDVHPLKFPLRIIVGDPLLIHGDDVADPIEIGSTVE